MKYSHGEPTFCGAIAAFLTHQKRCGLSDLVKMSMRATHDFSHLKKPFTTYCVFHSDNGQDMVYKLDSFVRLSVDE